jgi:cell division protein FtsL
MDQLTSTEGLVALLERDVQNLRTSIDKLVESNQELKNEIMEGKDEDRVYQNAIEVSLCHYKHKPN